MSSPRCEFLQSLQVLAPLQLPIGSYIIAGSGPLAIRNIRRAVDIDILVNAHLWTILEAKYEVSGAKQNLISIGKIEIWKDWMTLTEQIDEMIKNCDLIDGFPFMKLEYVVTWKEHFGRNKDLQDIELINTFLESSKMSKPMDV